MLIDPVSVAARAPTPALTLGVVKSDGYGSERRDSVNGFTFVTNHQLAKSGVHRHYVKSSKTLNAASPFSGIVTPVTCSASFSLVVPAFGFDDAAAAAIAMSLYDYILDSEVTLARLLGYQS